jgi:hypothetical protein
VGFFSYGMLRKKGRNEQKIHMIWDFINLALPVVEMVRNRDKIIDFRNRL